MVKKFFMLTALLSFLPAYSMEGRLLEVPHFEPEGSVHRTDTTSEENEELERLRIRENNSSPRSTDSRLSTTEEELHSLPATPPFSSITRTTPDSGIADTDDNGTRNLSPQALEKLHNDKHHLNFSPPKPRIATPEPIRANDEEIERLTEAYKEARAALPKDLVEDYKTKNEYQARVEGKQRGTEHLKNSSQIGDFPDQSNAIIERQEEVIAYLKSKIASIHAKEKIALRESWERSTDTLIKDIKTNSSHITDKAIVQKINALLSSMKEERTFMSEKTLVTDPDFDQIMVVRTHRIQELEEEIKALMSPQSKPNVRAQTQRTGS